MLSLFLLVTRSALATPTTDALVGGGHLLLFVPDVAAAMADARSVGFDPLPGTAGSEPDNAMVHLNNGWFIEFVDPTNFPRYVRLFTWFVPALDNRLDAWSSAGPGDVFDWSVDVSDINAARQDAIDNGIKMAAVREFSREQPNGQPTTWELSLPVDGSLPFFKSPYVGHVDVTAHMNHDNGARQLAGFTLVVPDVAEARERLGRVLNMAPSEGAFCVQDVEVRLEQGDTPAIKGVRLVSEGHTGVVSLAGAPVELVADSPRLCGG